MNDHNSAKIHEWEELCRKYPAVSPFVLLKLSMVWHGVKLTDRALSRLQEPDYRFGTAEPFGISFAGRTSGLIMPGPILLRDASFVYINYGADYADPYTADFDPETGLFLLYEGTALIDSIDFVPRPAFFGKYTSSGRLMDTIADVRAQKLILTAYQRCLFWKGGDQCHYCAFFTGGKSDPELDPEDAYETVREALKEPGRFSEVYLSGGSDYTGDPAFSNEIDRYIRVLSAIGRCFKGRFPSQLMAPAYRKEDVRRIFDSTGVTSYCPNIEVMDRELFRKLCPGKEKWVGYDEWEKRTFDAVDIFGRGNVYTQVVAGAELAKPHGFGSIDEALRSNLEGCENYAKHGVICLSTIWRPHRAARLGLQPMPPLEYYVRIAQGFHDIRKAYGLVCVDDDYKRCGNHPDSDLERSDRC